MGRAGPGRWTPNRVVSEGVRTGARRQSCILVKLLLGVKGRACPALAPERKGCQTFSKRAFLDPSAALTMRLMARTDVSLADLQSLQTVFLWTTVRVVGSHRGACVLCVFVASGLPAVGSWPEGQPTSEIRSVMMPLSVELMRQRCEQHYGEESGGERQATYRTGYKEVALAS